MLALCSSLFVLSQSLILLGPREASRSAFLKQAHICGRTLTVSLVSLSPVSVQLG